MKRLTATLAFCAMTIALSAQGSRIEHRTMPSDILGQDKSYTVYLPAGYDSPDSTAYPVLYLLHGAWGNDRDWTVKGNMQEIADQTFRSGFAGPMIIVMPDASGTGENFGGDHMGYFDVPGWDYERYFHEELIPRIDTEYRTIADKRHRAIAGLSMGGGGTAAYAQKHPDVYGSACSLSGLVGLAAESTGNPNDHFINSVSINDPTRFVENASPEQLDALRTVRWYADCGDDDFLYEGNIAFYRAMRQKNIPIEYRMRDGSHNWTYWTTALPSVLTFCSNGFAGN